MDVALKTLILQVKRKKFDVAPERNITVDLDNSGAVLIDSMEFLETHNLEAPIVITVPPSQPGELPACSDEIEKIACIDMDSDSDLDDIDDCQKTLKVNEFILVKCIYGAGSKKEAFKMFPCLIKNISKSTNGLVFICLFMRSCKGSATTFIFPTVEDRAEVKEENIILRLRLIQERRSRYEFDL